MSEHFKKIRNILIYILILNWAVAFAKVVYGLMTKCASMTADGVHSLSDGSSNIVGLAAIYAASKPIDKDHPYGHKKYETFAAIIIAIFLGILSLDIIERAIGRFSNPVVPEVNTLSFVIMIATTIVNIIVTKYEYKKGKQLKSDFLIADSYHTKADIFVSLSVIGTLVGIKLGLPILDPIVAIIIALVIGHSIIDIFRRSSGVLCDTAVVASHEIRDVVMGIKGVKDCHKIRTRGREDDVHVDLHLTVNTNMHIDKAHEICDLAEDKIKKSFPGVTDVTVHCEPTTKEER